MKFMIESQKSQANRKDMEAKETTTKIMVIGNDILGTNINSNQMISNVPKESIKGTDSNLKEII